jgi:hypothetical protein
MKSGIMEHKSGEKRKQQLKIRLTILIFMPHTLQIVNPLYSYLSKAKGMNVLWVLGCKAVNPSRFYIGIATPKIGSFYFPNFVE